MTSSDLNKVFTLIKKSNELGVQISLANEILSLKIPQKAQIDSVLLNELRSHKSLLLEYFKFLSYELHPGTAPKNFIDNHFYDGRDYYQITPVQLYWVNEKIDKEFKQIDEAHGTIIKTYEISGSFNIETFKKSIKYLIKRHESLRATFHFIENKFLMRVEDENSQLFDINLLTESQHTFNDQNIDDFINFKDHYFNLSEGPLFLVRLIEVKSGKYLVSVKIHHVIFDTWSSELLIRDLLVTYAALNKGQIPKLPKLEYQFKESLTLLNKNSKKNLESHKQYWKELYPTLAEELIIPCKKILNGTPTELKNIAKTDEFLIKDELVNQLYFLSSEFSTSIFVILQSTFKKFINSKTGQTDIVIGTYILGRDFISTENQIGCFATTVLIRSKFDSNDSFGEVISKVKKSNDDTKIYNAYTLIDSIKEIVFPEHNICGSFWKINLQFNDFSNNYENSVNSLMEVPIDLYLNAKTTKTTSHIAIDMQLNFEKVNQELKLKVDYDSSLYEIKDLQDFINEYLNYTYSLTMPNCN